MCATCFDRLKLGASHLAEVHCLCKTSRTNKNCTNVCDRSEKKNPDWMLTGSTKTFYVLANRNLKIHVPKKRKSRNFLPPLFRTSRIITLSLITFLRSARDGRPHKLLAELLFCRCIEATKRAGPFTIRN